MHHVAQLETFVVVEDYNDKGERDRVAATTGYFDEDDENDGNDALEWQQTGTT